MPQVNGGCLGRRSAARLRCDGPDGCGGDTPRTAVPPGRSPRDRPGWCRFHAMLCSTWHAAPAMMMSAVLRRQVRRPVLTGRGRSRCTAWARRGPRQMCGAATRRPRSRLTCDAHSLAHALSYTSQSMSGRETSGGPPQGYQNPTQYSHSENLFILLE
jgi:hypothetical protein